ncbi:MAG: PhnD/SsuA/transferrin family substrate-binding protein [Candidatus Schekmanbacteria bacterium]|nr:PhnD/SsuA/transferrin family substrate-binding protein [Candidatus Schekmanbacteria bacterium]
MRSRLAAIVAAGCIMALDATGIPAVAPAAPPAALEPRPAVRQEMAGLREQIAVYYFPDTAGRDLAEIAGKFQNYLTAVMGPALSARAKVLAFLHLADLEKYIESSKGTDHYPTAGVIHAEVALEKRKRWNLAMVGASVTNEGKVTHTISVVVRRDSPITELAQIRGKRVIAPELWGRRADRFEGEVLANAVRLSDLGELIPTTSSISAVMGVMYGQADAALMSSRVLEVLQDRSAAVWRMMREIHVSRPLPVLLTVLFQPVEAGEAAAITRELLRMHETTEGKALFDYTRLSHVVPRAWTELYSEKELEIAD